MGWITPLIGTTVGLDTAPLIYFIEKNTKYLSVLDTFFREVSLGNITLVTSTITLTEVLTRPLRVGDYALAQQYRDVLVNSANVVLTPVTEAIAADAAKLRATYGFRTPDAIQLATSRSAGAAVFLTNDAVLFSKKAAPAILLENLIGTP